MTLFRAVVIGLLISAHASLIMIARDADRTRHRVDALERARPADAMGTLWDCGVTPCKAIPR